MCANVDLYSGLIYDMLRIPPELFTPMFMAEFLAGALTVWRSCAPAAA